MQSSAEQGSGFTAEEKNKLVMELTPKIKSWVLRMGASLPDSVDLDDLYSSACLGLIESMERFDPSRNVNFYTFAERRIKGSILDTLRNLDFLPRNVRTRLKQLEAFMEKFYREHGRKPNFDEIISGTDFTSEDVTKLLDIHEKDKLLSLDEQVGTEGDTNLVDFIKSACLTPEDEVLKQKLITTLGEEIENLPEKERLAVTLYYYEELTMKEIAEVLDITESRVSQIHSSAVGRLKKKLREFL